MGMTVGGRLLAEATVKVFKDKRGMCESLEFWSCTCTPIFIAAISTIPKLWKESRCPSKDEWIKKMWSMYTMEYYSAIRRDEYPSFASKWIELEGIMLSEVSQWEKVNHMVSLIQGI